MLRLEKSNHGGLQKRGTERDASYCTTPMPCPCNTTVGASSMIAWRSNPDDHALAYDKSSDVDLVAVRMMIVRRAAMLLRYRYAMPTYACG
jgi:hypothetical protein